MNKTNEWKEQIGSSPLALALIGGTIGALIGRALGKERLQRASGQPDPRYRTAFADDRGVRYGSTADVRSAEYGSDAGWNDGRSASSGGGIGEKIADTAHGLKDMVANVRDRIPSPGEMVSNVRERELLEPVKQRAGEAIGSLGDKIGDSVQQARRRSPGSRRSRSSRPGNARSRPALTH